MSENLLDALPEYQAFLPRLSGYSEDDGAKIREAALYSATMHAGQTRASGEPYVIHPLSVAGILIDMRMDTPTIIAALLHDVEEDTSASREDIIARFGVEVERLVDGVTKISIAEAKNKSGQQAATIHKMFLAMSVDIRVVIIKMADKLHNMSTLSYKPAKKQASTARECLDIYAPLAGKLSMYWMKRRFEDMALEYVDPEANEAIKTYVYDREEAWNVLFIGISTRVKILAMVAGMEVRIERSRRNLFSYYRRANMSATAVKTLRMPFELRIICRATADCYRVVGLLHQLYKPVEGLFRDYIAMPKENNYRGLHTMVVGPTGDRCEVHVRTDEMDKSDEYGVAAYWMFSETGSYNPKDLGLIARIKGWEGLDPAGETFLHSVREEMLTQSIYVFDLAGNSYDLPAGSTVLDFAFRLGGGVGLHYKRAKVDGDPVKPGMVLTGSRVVEVEVESSQELSLEWITDVTSPRAKALIIAGYRGRGRSLVTVGDITAAIPVDTPTVTRYRTAKCCKPTRANHIVAKLVATGLEIHRRECPKVRRRDFMPIEAVWTKIRGVIGRYRLEAQYVPDLLASIERAVVKTGGRILRGELTAETGEFIVAIFSIQFKDAAKSDDFLRGLRKISAVKKVKRG